MRRVFISFVLLLAFMLVFAGCGGSSKSKSKSKSTPSNVSASVPGAEMAPASALAFASISTDSTGAQWQQAQKLLARVPAAQKALDKLFTQIGVNLADVEQALGPNTSIVELGTAAKPLGVVLTEPRDAAKLKSLLAGVKSKKKILTAEVGSWLAASDSQAALDQLQSEVAKGKLSDSSTFKQAVAGLPADALARVYFTGSTISSATSAITSGTSTSTTSSLLNNAIKKNQLDWAALAVKAVADGFSVEGIFKGQKALANSTSTLIAELPSETAFLVDLNGKALGLDKAVTNLRSNAKYGSQVTQMEAVLGVKLEDVAALAGSEMAVYGTGSGIGLLIKAPDPAKATLLIDKVVALLSAQLGGKSKTLSVGGAQAHQLTLGKTTLYVGVKGSDLFLATNPAVLPGTSQLSSDPVYAAAAKALPVPDANAGVAYVNFEQLAALSTSNDPLVQSLSKLLKSSVTQLGGSSTQLNTDPDLQGLSALLGYIVANGDKVELKAQLTVK